MKKLNNKKGFTLMEMLIVVAIIAILVAIAIPTFSGSLKKAQSAADEANVRSAYAEATTKSLTNDGTGEGETPALQNSGTYDFGSTTASWTAGQKVTITVTNGTITWSAHS